MSRPLPAAMPSPVALLMLAVSLALVAPEAQAQIAVTENGPVTLSATNKGTVTINGTVTDASIAGTNNSLSLTSQGAVVNHQTQDDVHSITDGSTGEISASVSGAELSGTNSGTTTTNGTIKGLSQAGQGSTVTISAVGVQSGITVNTSSSNSTGK